MAGAKAQLDQGSRVGQLLGLPAVIGLEARHGFFAASVPNAIGLAGKVVLADQRRLDVAHAVGVHGLLSARTTLAVPSARFGLPGVCGTGMLLGRLLGAGG